MKSVVLAIGCALLSLTASTASSQQLVTLDEAVRAGAEDSYPFVRCAAFYFSVIDYAGTEAFDEEYVERTVSSIDYLIMGAIHVRTESGNMNVVAVSEAVHEEALAISTLYVERYKRNYAAGGQAFGNDSLWASDAILCKFLIEGDN